MVLFNFRSDRMVEISKAFEYEEFSAFDRKRFPKASASPCLPACARSASLLGSSCAAWDQCPHACLAKNDAFAVGVATLCVKTSISHVGRGFGPSVGNLAAA